MTAARPLQRADAMRVFQSFSQGNSMSFDTLGLKPELLRAVADKGYTVPTPIQLRGHSGRALRPRRARGRADRHRQDRRLHAADAAEASARRGARNPRALVLTPTRELAAQVAQSVQRLRQVRRAAHVVIFGGVSEQPADRQLRRGCDILVATPGRLLDLCEQRAVSTVRGARSSCSTKPTACSTWASSATSSAILEDAAASSART